MYNLTLEESMLCAKIFAFAMGDRGSTLKKADKDAAVSLLKRMADQKWDWTSQQRELFKD